jgi:nicotinate-nucleotide adenylyltransferase
VLRPLGLLGGAFDPIHNGHLRLAIEVREHLGLEEVRFIPLAGAHHRPDPRAPASLRAAMLEAAIAGEPGLSVDARELDRGGVSYTVDTLTSLRAEFGARPLVWLLGADAFAGLARWHRWRELPGLTHFAIADRTGAVDPTEPELRDLLARSRCEDPATLARRPAGLIVNVVVPVLDISATAVRARVRAGASVRGLVPDAVLTVIRNHGLYGHEC